MGADHLDQEHLGRHSPLTIAELSDLMLGAPFRWCVAGGLAIDRLLGRATREHGDLDVAVFRKDDGLVRKWLAGWELWCAGSPGSGLHRLHIEDRLPADAHGIWCRRLESEPWSFEILIEESSFQDWLYRRNRLVTLPLEALMHGSQGVPVMAPEVVLLYKAKSPRERDRDDFYAALPLLRARQREWLKSAIAQAHPACPWLSEL
jgi:aminoglycoside-2''-adenylyltransferase